MSIAVVTTSYPAYAGDPSGHFVAADVRELEQQGHAVRVIAAQGEAFGWPGMASRIGERPSRMFDAMRWGLVARRELSSLTDCDRVVAHWAVPCAWPIGTAWKGPIDVVSHGADVRLLCRLPAVARNWIVGDIAKTLGQWRFVSEELRSSLLNKLPTKLRTQVFERSIVKPSAIVVRVAEPTGAWELPRPLYVAVGRMVESKRLDRAIRWMAERPGSLVLVGDGPMRSELQAQAERDSARTHFTGLVARELSLGWIKSADAMLFTSDVEGASSVMREADALGCRVIDLTGRGSRHRHWQNR